MGSTNIETISILPKLMDKFNMTSNKIPKHFRLGRESQPNYFGRRDKLAGIFVRKY
jgi:hypothetical protein